MAVLEFEDLSFEERHGEIVIRLLNLFHCVVPKTELEQIGPFIIGRHSVEFKGVTDKKASARFNQLLQRHLKQLTNTLTNRPAHYFHQNSGVPLIGVRYIGIVDKGTNLLELKPMTGCNISCTFCSVDEGPLSKKKTDYFIEEEYLVQETARLLEAKQAAGIHVYINPHGDPLLYPRLVQLVSDLRPLQGVANISVITNGSLLTPTLIQNLAAAGLTHLHISMNAFSQQAAEKIAASTAYSISHVKAMAKFAAGRMKVVLTPVLLKGVNEQEIEQVIAFGREINAEVSIQKFTVTKRGRNPIKEQSWESFNALLEEWQQAFEIKLLPDEKLEQTKELPMPFKRGAVVQTEIVAPGRSSGELLCKAQDRLITVFGHGKPGETVKVKILAASHNLFTGKVI